MRWKGPAKQGFEFAENQRNRFPTTNGLGRPTTARAGTPGQIGLSERKTCMAAEGLSPRRRTPDAINCYPPDSRPSAHALPARRSQPALAEEARRPTVFNLLFFRGYGLPRAIRTDKRGAATPGIARSLTTQRVVAAASLSGTEPAVEHGLPRGGPWGAAVLDRQSAV